MSIYADEPITWGNDTVIDSDCMNKEVKTKLNEIDTYASTVFPCPDSLNLAITMNAVNPTYQIDVDADLLKLWDSANAKGKLFSSIDSTIDISAGTGANKLDTGSEAANTWYYIWVIGKSDGTKAGLFSTSSTAPTMPAGYTYKLLIGAIRNNASSNFIPGTWDNGWFNYNLGQQVYSGNGITSWTDADLSQWVPDGITKTLVEVRVFTNTGGNTICFRKNGDTIDYVPVNQSAPFTIPVDLNGIIEHINGSNAKALSWGITGYKN